MAKRNTVERFIDVDKEPTKTLLPIEGYEKKPLLSLKDAVTAIETPIHNLEKMVWTAERNCRSPADGLTVDESASIHLYSMESPDQHASFYSLLNEKLRSEKRKELTSWYSYMKLFLTALHKLPSLKMIVWRGIRGNVHLSYEKNSTCIWWGVSSCTETMDVMKKFLRDCDHRTIFMIECIHGKKIKPHAFYPTEDEIILMPGTYLRVIDKSRVSSDLDIIHLREEIPPFPFLASPINSSPSSASVNSLPIKKLAISQPRESNNQAVSIPSSSKGFLSLLLFLKFLFTSIC